MNGTWIIQPGMKAFLKYSPTENFSQELSAIVLLGAGRHAQILKQEDNALWSCIVGRSMYKDKDSCTELVVWTSLPSSALAR